MSLLTDSLTSVKTRLQPDPTAGHSEDPPLGVAKHSMVVDRLPDINLAPAAARVDYQKWLWKRRVIYAAIALIAAIVVLWLAQAAAISWAQRQLDTETARADTLAAQKARLAPVSALNAQIDMQRNALIRAQSTNVDVSGQLSTLRTALGTATVSQLTVTLPGDPSVNAAATAGGAAGAVSPCGDNADPFTSQQLIGCIKFTATANSRSDIAAILNRLQASPGFAAATVTSTDNVTKGAGVEFDGSVALTPAAYNEPTPQPAAAPAAPTGD